MKNDEPIQSIDIEKVDSLETYMFHLALLCVSVQTLYALQKKAESLGIFDSDEEEASKTVKYQASRLFQVIDDLLRMCASRTNLEWDQLMVKVLQSAQEHLEKKPKVAPKRTVRRKKKA